MRASRTLAILCLVLLGLCAIGASAQQPASDDLQRRFQEARQKLEAGDHKSVVALLEPLKSDPNTPPPILTLLGAAYIEMGRFKEAQAILDPAASKETAGPPLLFNAGRAALALGQDEKGESYLKRAIAQAPQSLAARALGLRYGRQGKVLDAYELLRPWAQAHPDDQEARLAAAFCAIELGRGSEADPLLEGLPDDRPQVRLLRARLLLGRGDPRGAISILAPLEASPPKEIERDLRWVLGESRMRTGEASAVVALLEGHTGNDPALALLLAQAHQQTGSPEKVLATLKPFVDQLPDPAQVEPSQRSINAAMALEYGRALVAGARWAEAAAVLEKATVLDPSNAPAWQVFGQALAGAGRRDEARQALEKFQELSQASLQNQGG
jgi:predicted Zn-dependent protease